MLTDRLAYLSEKNVRFLIVRVNLRIRVRSIIPYFILPELIDQKIELVLVTENTSAATVYMTHISN